MILFPFSSSCLSLLHQINDIYYPTFLSLKTQSPVSSLSFCNWEAFYLIRQANSDRFVSVVVETRFKLVEPDFIRTLRSCDAFEGGPFALECQVSGSPTPSVSWYKENESVDNSSEYVITKINGTCTLRTKSSKAEHTGRYTCLATNSAGEASSTARVNVIRKNLCVRCH